MMKLKQITALVFGLLAVTVGAWRHLETGDSPQALWFGVVTGGMAVAGAILLPRRRVTAYTLIVVSLAFVAGWFLRRVFSGHAEGLSPRIILILAACAVETVALLIRPRRS